MTTDEDTPVSTCPKCGDEVPFALGDYECAGTGHHVLALRSSVYPAVTQADIDRAWVRAARNVCVVLALLLAGLIAAFAVKVCA